MGLVLLKRPPEPTYAWVQATGAASWLARDGAGLVWWEPTKEVLIVGGWDGGSPAPGQNGQTLYPGRPTTNQIVASSYPFTAWTEVLAHVENPPQTGPGARFFRRHSHGCFVHRHAGTDYLYVIGGDHLCSGFDVFSQGPSRGYVCDVWRSADPKNPNGWERVASSDSVGWTGRMLAVHGSHEGALYTVGGQNGLLGAPVGNPVTSFTGPLDPTFYNDVWKSTDGGATYTRILDNAPWSSRGIVGKLLSWRGRMWLLTGGHYPTGAAENGPPYITSNPRTWFREVWSSSDGISWYRHANAPCSPRHYTCVEVWDDRLWIGTGYSNNAINVGDFFSTGDGEKWTNHGAAPFAPGHADGLCATPYGLMHATGNGTLQTGVRDVYLLQRTS